VLFLVPVLGRSAVSVGEQGDPFGGGGQVEPFFLSCLAEVLRLAVEA
jgi:hypothetical protein